MPRRIRADMLPLDNELEKTISNLKKERAVSGTSIIAYLRIANRKIPVVVVDTPQ